MSSGLPAVGRRGAKWRHLWGRRLPWTIVVAAALALLGSACGESDEDKVQKVVQTYLDALVDGDGELACGQLSAREQATVIRGVRRQQDGRGEISCAQAIEAFQPFFREAQLEAVDVEVEMDRATAAGRLTGESAPGQSRESRTLKRYVLRQFDGEWRIDQQIG